MGHCTLEELLEPIHDLFKDVKRKALMRLEYEGLHTAEVIVTPGARFYNDAASYAMDRYAYYVCYKCNKVINIYNNFVFKIIITDCINIRHIMVVKHVVMLRLVKITIQPSWFVVPVRMLPGHKCVLSTALIFWNTSVVIVVPVPSFSVLERLIFAIRVMMISKG